MKKFVSFLPIIFQLIILIVFFSLGSAYYLKNSPNPLYRAIRIITPDATLGWRQKSNLDTIFEAATVTTDVHGFRIYDDEKNSHSNKPISDYILTLGPSSAFGWGVEGHETYSSIVANKLGLKPMNASGIGHSIHQGTLQLNQIMTNDGRMKHVRYALIAYGVNDLDKFRFFDSYSNKDKDYFQTFNVSELDKAIYQYSFSSLIHLAWRKFSYQKSCQHLENIEPRVPWIDFEKQLLNMITSLTKMNIKVVILNTPFLLKNKMTTFNSNMIEQLYKEVEFKARNKQCESAHEIFLKAKVLEPNNILEQVQIFNGKLKKLANEKSWTYIDSFTLLKDNPTMFYDPVHPSKNGHHLLANEMIKALRAN